MLTTAHRPTAINKPTGSSSAQILRDLQTHFNPSQAFAPWISAERARRDAENPNQWQKRSRRSRQPVQVKLGHGGTLDPLATGVLIVGVGTGTKSLQGFLECKKTYEAVMMFGAATDTYDSEGKIVKRAPFEHITRAKVEDALSKFRGDIMQRPPIYSALKVNGKKLYEYAREGKEVPIEIQERPVTVSELDIVEWMDGGSHKFDFPAQEAEDAEKQVADKLLHLDEIVNEGEKEAHEQDTTDGANLKRKRDDTTTGEAAEDAALASSKKAKQEQEQESSAPTPAALAQPSDPSTATTAPGEPQAPPQERTPCPAPAVRLRMTVSSGFYVRSLCHDLGAAVNSLGFMTQLERTRQHDFEVGSNALDYDDLAKGEDVWAPKVTAMLAQWNEKYPNGIGPAAQKDGNEGGSGKKQGPNNGGRRQHGHERNHNRQNGSRPNQHEQSQRRRNSSSPEA